MPKKRKRVDTPFDAEENNTRPSKLSRMEGEAPGEGEHEGEDQTEEENTPSLALKSLLDGRPVHTVLFQAEEIVVDDNFNQFKAFLDAVINKKKSGKPKKPKEIVDSLCYFILGFKGDFHRSSGLFQKLLERRNWEWITYAFNLLSKHIKKYKPYQIYTLENIQRLIAHHLFDRASYESGIGRTARAFENFVKQYNIDLNAPAQILEDKKKKKTASEKFLMEDDDEGEDSNEDSSNSSEYIELLDFLDKSTRNENHAKLLVKLGAKATIAQCLLAAKEGTPLLLKAYLQSGQFSPAELQGKLECALENDISKENLQILITRGLKISSGYDAYKYAGFLAKYGLSELYEIECKRLYEQDQRYIENWPEKYNPVKLIFSSRHFDPSSIKLLSFIIAHQERLIKMLPTAVLGDFYLHFLDKPEAYRRIAFGNKLSPVPLEVERPIPSWSDSEKHRLVEVLHPITKMLGGVTLLPFNSIFNKLLIFSDLAFIRSIVLFLINPENGIKDQQFIVQKKTIIEHFFQCDLASIFRTQQGVVILEAFLEKYRDPNYLLKTLVDCLVQNETVTDIEKETLKAILQVFGKDSIKSLVNPKMIQSLLTKWIESFRTSLYPIALEMMDLLISLNGKHPIAHAAGLLATVITGYHVRVSNNNKTYKFNGQFLDASNELRVHLPAQEQEELKLIQYLLSLNINPFVKQTWNNRELSFLEIVARSNLFNKNLILHQNFFLQDEKYKKPMALAVQKMTAQVVSEQYLGNSRQEIGLRGFIQATLIQNINALANKYLRNISLDEHFQYVKNLHLSYTNALSSSLEEHVTSYYRKKYNLNPEQFPQHQKMLNTLVNLVFNNLNEIAKKPTKCKENEIIWDLPQFQALRAYLIIKNHLSGANAAKEFSCLENAIGLIWHNIQDASIYPASLQQELKQQFTACLANIGKILEQGQPTTMPFLIQNIMYKLLQNIQLPCNTIINIQKPDEAAVFKEFKTFYLKKFKQLKPEEQQKIRFESQQNNLLAQVFIEQYKNEFLQLYRQEISFQVIDQKLLISLFNSPHSIDNFKEITNTSEPKPIPMVIDTQPGTLLIQFRQQSAGTTGQGQATSTQPSNNKPSHAKQ